jgi:phosphate transport system permease protein
VNATFAHEPQLVPAQSRKSGAGADRLFALLTAGAAWLVLILLGVAAASMAWGGRLAFKTFGWRFITSRDWDAVSGHFGAFVPIVGTLITSAIALIIAVLVSIGIALGLSLD